MKTLIQRLIAGYRARKRQEFSEMPSWLLSMLGAPSALIAWYLAKGLADVGSPYLSAVDKVGMWNLPALLLGAFLLVMATNLFFFGAIAARCGEVLKKRWFA